MDLLVLLERLSPVERAVYVLREAFDYSHREIAGLLEMSEANCRQLYRRATARVTAPPSRFSADPAQWRDLVETFLAAARGGDPDRLEGPLAADVRFVSDGGGVVGSVRRPVLGPERVARVAADVLQNFAASLPVRVAEVNGEPALTFGDAGVLLIEFEDRLVSDMRAVANPGKLEFLRRQLSHS